MNEKKESNSKTSKRIALIFILLLLTLIGLIMLLGKFNCQGKPQQGDGNKIAGGSVLIIDTNAIDKSEAVQAQKNPLVDRNVFFAGYTDATLTKVTTVALENLPENEDFLLKYIITDAKNEAVVFETNLIRSGQCVVWTPGESLGTGTYDLQFLAVPYYQDVNGNFTQLTTGHSQIRYTITE